MSGEHTGNVEKVNWLRETELAGGVKVSISQKSGIVKVQLPSMGGFRSVLMYRDEFEAFRQFLPQIQAYCKANEDVALSQDENKNRSKAARTAMKNQAKIAEVLNALTPAQLEAILKSKQNVG